jgi:hypothetical protein
MQLLKRRRPRTRSSRGARDVTAWRATACYGAALVLAFAAPASCHKPGRKGGKAKADEGIHKTFERGPVSVAIDLDRAEPTIADRLHLKLQVTADEAYHVELPHFGEQLESFGIVDYHTEPPVLIDGDKTRRSRTYVLEPFLSGEYEIPPMTIRFWKKGEKDQPHTLETETLKVHVKSLRPEQLGKLTLHDIEGPVSLPRTRKGWIVAGAAALAAGALAGALWVWRRRARRGEGRAEPRVPAHELAYRELAALVAEELPQKGEVKRFYQRLSGILRRYIENRFALRAPEQTTEEFLVSLREDPRLAGEHKRMLNDFLGHCDLVKFAEHQPQTRDIQSTFDSCKAFILQTEEREEAAAAAGG